VHNISQAGPVFALTIVAALGVLACSSAPPRDEQTSTGDSPPPTFEGWKLHWSQVGAIEQARRGALPEWTDNPGRYVQYSWEPGGFRVTAIANEPFDSGLYIAPGAREVCLVGTFSSRPEGFVKPADIARPLPSDIPVNEESFAFTCKADSRASGGPCAHDLVQRGRGGRATIDLVSFRKLLAVALPAVEKDIAETKPDNDVGARARVIQKQQQVLLDRQKQVAKTNPAQAVRDLFLSPYQRCGKNFVKKTGDGAYLLLRGDRFDLKAWPMSEADRLNGILWQGRAGIFAKTHMDVTPDESPKWESWPGYALPADSEDFIVRRDGTITDSQDEELPPVSNAWNCKELQSQPWYPRE
jgi:hypothetical protein